MARCLTLCFCAAILAAADAQEADLRAMTSRLSEEAEVFAQNARALLSEETLRQRTLKPARRPRIGSVAPAPDEYVAREIVSEYGFASFKDSPGALHEFRQVVSIDSRPIVSREKARQTLTMGVTSADDRLKKQMLRDFEKHGLVGAVTDFGQLILLFTKRGIGNYEFQLRGRERVGAEDAAVITFRQRGGDTSLTIFSGREAVRSTLEGAIWIRQPDNLPLRIRLTSQRREAEFTIRTEATVDYAMSPHGALTPAAVAHREWANGRLLTENLFDYAPFRRFGAQSELKFTEIP
jgi:hypothetical protein